MVTGRPPIWTDPDEFSKKVDEYFDSEKHATWSGLALYLGFESRQSLEDYKKKEGFSYPIKKALLKIEQIYEQNLQKPNPAGSIFALKNFGWKDKSEVENNTVIRMLTRAEPGNYSYPVPPTPADEGSGRVDESL